MSKKRVPGWVFAAGLLALGSYIGFMNWRYDDAECDQLMRALENNTGNEIIHRLDAECPGWESNS